jgi:hypothetical protein
VGNASVPTSIAKWNQGSGGSSLAFDGDGDQFTAANINANNADLTIECWLRLNAYPAGGAIIACTYSGTTFETQLNTFLFYVTSAGAVSAAGAVGGASTTATIPLNTWVHVAFVYTHSNQTRRAYLNGNAGPSYSGEALTNTTVTSVFIGGSSGAANVGTWWLNGYIDDLRITKGITRYTSNFTPPAAELPANITDDPSYNSVSLLLRNGTPGPLVLLDESPTPKTIIAYGTAGISTTTFKYGGSALSLPGNASSYFTAPSNAFVATNTEAFTIEFWAYVVTLTSGFVISNYTASDFGFGISVTSGKIGVTLVGDGEQMSGGAPVLNSWNHVALSGTPVSPGLMLFLNGSKQGSTYTGGVSLGSTTVVVTIGRLGNTATQPFNSLIDDLRITKNIARYNKNFLPSPAQLPAI